MKNSSLTRFATLATSTVLLSSTSVWAQNVPSSALPSTIERQYRLQDDRPTINTAPLVTLPEQGTKPVSGKTTFKLNGVKLEGAKAIDEAELKALYADKLNTTISLNELNGIADSITSYYRNHGYILTRATVPPQRAEGGVITIRITEGFVSAVKLEGDKADDAQLRKYADKIMASKPLDSKKLERYLLLMDDLPGVQARAVLQPSPDTPGATEVVVTITRKPVEFAATLDNRGSRYLGPVQASASASVNNLFGLDEQTQIRVANSIFDPEELKYVEVRHEQQLGGEGTKLVVSGSHVETQPGYTLKILELESESNAFSAGLSHPILRTRQSNWFVNGDFTLRNVEADTFAGDLYYDKTRVFSLGTSYDFLDSTSAINRMDVTFANGIGRGTETGQDKSRNNGDASFKKFQGKATRIQPVGGPWSLYGAVAGQYSFDPLLASEEFTLGGTEFGSAYDSAELTGDSGLATRLEVQYNQSRESDFFSQYQVYTFYDIGRVWNTDIIGGAETNHSSLSSTGVGMRFNLLESLSGGVEGSLPLTRKVAAYGADGASPRAFFNLQYRY